MLVQNLKMFLKMRALSRKKTKLFSKKSIFQIKMVLAEQIVLLHKGNLNLFPIRVRDRQNQFFIKIHSMMTISTRINRKVTILTAKSFSKSNIDFPLLMIFCRSFIPTLFFQLWQKILYN